MDISNESLCIDITKFKEIEGELRKNIECQGFIIKLCDMLRSLSDEKSILDSASSLLIKYLNVSQVCYSHYSEDKVIVSKEIQDDDTIAVPIYKNDHIVATLSIKNSTPRLWSTDEVELVRGVGQRIYAAVDRVRFEKVLQDSEAKYRKLFETSNDGFWWEDKYGYVTEANEGTAKMLGYSQEELIGRHWKDFIDDEWLHIVYKQWKAHKGRRPNRYEIKLKKKDESSIWVKISIASLIDEGGEYIGTLIAFNDITEQKKADEKLRKSEKKAIALVSELKRRNKNKDEFISMLSHELRNPLAAIIGGIELLELTNKNEKISTTIKILKRQTEQLSKLVDDLLDITRITQKKIILNKEAINLNTIVNNAIIDIKPQFEKKGIRLLEDICIQPIVVNADSLRITQCIGNILGNALKFTQENGIVRISLKIEEKSAVINIQDNGIGISLDMLTKIFEPFKQDSNAFNSCHNRGLGLGLSIVKNIMNMHDGKISVSSPGLEKGSIFTMRLPTL